MAENPNRLIVEGSTDQYSIIQLMKAHVSWPDVKGSWPVEVIVGEGIDQILRQGYLTTQFKVAHRRRLGVVLDSDSSASSRFNSVRKLLSTIGIDFPSRIDSEGLVAQDAEGKRFGLWIMPDNRSAGTIETFLRQLIPETQKELWHHAVASTQQSRTRGATFKDVQSEKAELHTWLAWQDRPGEGAGLALMRKILNPNSPAASSFVNWFRTLYEL